MEPSAKAKETGHKVVAAAIIVREDDGAILGLQRPPGKWGAGKWEFPGGKVAVGENPRAALVRECEEELGITAVAGAAYEILSHRYDDLPPVILLFFRTRIVSGEPRSLEGGRAEWIAPRNLRDYDWLEADWPIVEELAR
ncbi:MAG: (deoxy)nucleoside triphosphate pyrophosphohydrolase [Sumerlaeia bacterium]